MAIVDELTPRQCLVLGEILDQPSGLLRVDIAVRIHKDEKTVERILASLPRSVLRKKRDRTLNGAPYRYRAKLSRRSYTAFRQKWEKAQKQIVPGIVPSTVPGPTTLSDNPTK